MTRLRNAEGANTPAEQPSTTAPAVPKIKILVVRPVTPSQVPVPQQAPSTSAPALGT